MNKEINKCCCFTGHRTEKLNNSEETISLKLSKEIQKAVDKGITTFITGMAEGVDIWAALEVLKLRENNKKLNLICVIPYVGFEKSRSKEEKEKFNKIISQAIHTEYIFFKYARWCFSERNKWMVDNSCMVIAVFNGTEGGTKQTLDYASKKNKEIVMIEDKKDDNNY